MAITPDTPGLFLLSLTLHPFPISESGYFESMWFKWIERIMLSHDAHADELIAANNGNDRIETEQQFDSASTLYAITENMYAAIIVTVQSYIE